MNADRIRAAAIVLSVLAVWIAALMSERFALKLAALPGRLYGARAKLGTFTVGMALGYVLAMLRIWWWAR